MEGTRAPLDREHGRNPNEEDPPREPHGGIAHAGDTQEQLQLELLLLDELVELHHEVEDGGEEDQSRRYEHADVAAVVGEDTRVREAGEADLEVELLVGLDPKDGLLDRRLHGKLNVAPLDGAVLATEDAVSRVVVLHRDGRTVQAEDGWKVQSSDDAQRIVGEEGVDVLGRVEVGHLGYLDLRVVLEQPVHHLPNQVGRDGVRIRRVVHDGERVLAEAIEMGKIGTGGHGADVLGRVVHPLEGVFVEPVVVVAVIHLECEDDEDCAAREADVRGR